MCLLWAPQLYDGKMLIFERSAVLANTSLCSVSTPVTSAMATVVFGCVRRISRIGDAIWLGPSAEVATW
jgi:hypothetical protein